MWNYKIFKSNSKRHKTIKYCLNKNCLCINNKHTLIGNLQFLQDNSLSLFRTQGSAGQKGTFFYVL